jgi:Tfp pilus assembly protein PilN
MTRVQRLPPANLFIPLHEREIQVENITSHASFPPATALLSTQEENLSSQGEKVAAETTDLESNTVRQSTFPFKKVLLAVLGFVLVGVCSGALYVFVLDKTGSTKNMLLKAFGAHNQDLKRATSRALETNSKPLQSVPVVLGSLSKEPKTALSSSKKTPAIILGIVVLLILAGAAVGGYFLYQKIAEDQQYSTHGVSQLNDDLKAKQGEIDRLNNEIGTKNAAIENLEGLEKSKPDTRIFALVLYAVSCVVNGAITIYSHILLRNQDKASKLLLGVFPNRMILWLFIGVNLLFLLSSIVCSLVTGQYFALISYIASFFPLLIILVVAQRSFYSKCYGQLCQ